MTERWKPVVGFEGWYEVSDLGNVRGLSRVLSDGRNWKASTVRQKPSRFGHMSVRLCKDGHHWLWVHRIVLEAFAGPCPPGQEGAHNNGIPGDNRLGNLRWDTRKGNHADKASHGTALIGTRNHRSKLTPGIIEKIFELNSRGVTGRAIAAQFECTPANVSSVLAGKTWSHVRRFA